MYYRVYACNMIILGLDENVRKSSYALFCIFEFFYWILTFDWFSPVAAEILVDIYIYIYIHTTTMTLTWSNENDYYNISI